MPRQIIIEVDDEENVETGNALAKEFYDWVKKEWLSKDSILEPLTQMSGLPSWFINSVVDFGESNKRQMVIFGIWLATRQKNIS